MKKLFIIALTMLSTVAVSAQEKKPVKWINNVKLSGYGMLQYKGSTQKGGKSNSFDLRLARVSLDGRIFNDWYWKAQIQFNGNTATLGSSPRVVDLFVEWQRFPFLMVKAGQFKRPFTFENPMHPIDQGFMSYSQNVSALAGFSDRAGAQASNGRDIGVQLQGDFLKNSEGRNLLHYQIGVFNGQGINTTDADQQKDIIGGIWVMPVKGMRIGAFGWTGSYARKGTWKTIAEDGVTEVEHSGVRSLQQRRYAFSAEYKVSDWTFRTEYIHSTGKAFKTRNQKSGDTSDCTVNEAVGSQADGVYALVIAPVLTKKLYAKARYDMYRPTAEWNKMKTQYEIGLNYLFHKNIQVNAEYAFVNDRSLAADSHNYSVFDVELDFRF